MINADSKFDARAVAAAAAATLGPAVERRRRLSPEALAITNRKVAKPRSPVVITGLVRLVDFTMLSVIGITLCFGSTSLVDGFRWDVLAEIFCMVAAAVLSFGVTGIYDFQALRGRVQRANRMVLIWTCVVASFIGADIIMKPSGSPHWLVWFHFFGLAALMISRAMLQSVLVKWTRQGRFDRRIVVVGADQHGERLIEALKKQAASDIVVLGVFDDRTDDRSLETCAGVPNLGAVDQIAEFARRTRIDLVLFALPISAETRILQMLNKLWVLPVDIRLSAHENKLRFQRHSYSYLGDVPMLDVCQRPISDWGLVAKWLFDHVIGFLLLVAALPVMALAAIAIKLDSPGPVFFRQKRFGFNNERVDVLKFRTMYDDQADPMATKVVTRGDPRVTRVGRILRKSSLDELPQLFNVVFKNNLSLVGPRPHAVQAKLENRPFDEVVDGYFARHKIKPGITGWAQINGWRGEVDTDEKIQKRVDCDLYYIENWSLLFDVYILLKTPMSLISKSDNAY